MKRFSLIPLAAALSLSACDSMNRPISSGSFDPLAPPGSGYDSNSTPVEAFRAGEFARASIDNTAFFARKPDGNASADRLLSRGTSMKVISVAGSYAKVELDSGEVGYVPTVMMENPNSANNGLQVVNPNEMQVYPPINVPGIPMETDIPPGGTIPTVIDPDAPSVPLSDPAFEADPGPAPLPPNDEDLQRAAEEAAKAGDEAPAPVAPSSDTPALEQ